MDMTRDAHGHVGGLFFVYWKSVSTPATRLHYCPLRVTR